ncbi:MAG: ABC transporter ATP-binding protein [bacterium]
MNALLSATDLGRTDNGNHRLRDFNLELKTGEVIGILGVNGAGKSTALALLSGSLAASSGNILIDGQPFRKSNRGSIGLLPESPPLYPELTVSENLAFAGRLRGLESSNLESAITRALGQCDLLDHQFRLARQLSKGLQLRVAIAQAIIHQPRILLLDEPTAGLDPLQARQLQALLKQLSLSCGVIIASHDLADIQALCDRVIVLDAGTQVLAHDLKQSTTTTVRVQLASTPSDSELNNIPGIVRASRLEDQWWLLELDSTDTQVAELLAQQHWGLNAYVPDQPGSATYLYDLIAREVGR